MNTVVCLVVSQEHNRSSPTFTCSSKDQLHTWQNECLLPRCLTFQIIVNSTQLNSA